MSLTDDQQKALDMHNAERAAMGVPPLVWDAGLAAAAQARANVIAPIDALLDSLHDPNAGAGENLWELDGLSDVLDAYSHAASDWLNEKSVWNQANPFDDNLSAGHYTQCIWGRTTRVGMGKADRSNTCKLVARYLAQGNVVGEGVLDHDGSAGQGNSGPHGLLFLNGTISPQIGIIQFRRSAVAYYDKIFNVINIQPDAFVVTAVDALTQWEGSGSTNLFPDGNVVDWNIEADAQSKPFLAKVGNAENRNGLSFDIFKDDQHYVFDKEGYSWNVIYYAQAV